MVIVILISNPHVTTLIVLLPRYRYGTQSTLLLVCKTSMRHSLFLAVPLLQGSRGRAPRNGCLCLHFGLLQILFLEHHAMTRQQTIMEKGIITFKHNSPSTFS